MPRQRTGCRHKILARAVGRARRENTNRMTVSQPENPFEVPGRVMVDHGAAIK